MPHNTPSVPGEGFSAIYIVHLFYCITIGMFGSPVCLEPGCPLTCNNLDSGGYSCECEQYYQPQEGTRCVEGLYDTNKSWDCLKHIFYANAFIHCTFAITMHPIIYTYSIK